MFIYIKNELKSINLKIAKLKYEFNMVSAVVDSNGKIIELFNDKYETVEDAQGDLILIIGETLSLGTIHFNNKNADITDLKEWSIKPYEID